MKPVQYFSDEYLNQCKETSLEQRLQFLEDFRLLQAKKSPSKLISMKIPQNLLKAFKGRCEMANIPYQTQIKKLMRDWLK